MGRKIEEFKCKSLFNGNNSELCTVYHFKGARNGQTDLTITTTNGQEATITLLTKEDAISLASFLQNEINHVNASQTVEPTYEISGYAIMVMCNGTVLKTVYRDTDKEYDPDGLSYKKLIQEFPNTGDENYYFVVFPLRDGSYSKETINKVVKACVDLQKEVLITGDLRVAKPMTQLKIKAITGIDNTSVSRIVRGVRILTSHRNYSLESNNGSLEFPSLFSEGLETSDGGEVSALGVRMILQALIETEDKSHPFTDNALSERLSKYGYNIARRTVAKYRDDVLGIPNSRKRKVVNQ